MIGRAENVKGRLTDPSPHAPRTAATPSCTYNAILHLFGQLDAGVDIGVEDVDHQIDDDDHDPDFHDHPLHEREVALKDASVPGSARS